VQEKLNIPKLLSPKKGISPIIATLLLILIAIAAGVVVYAYVLGFVGNSTGNSGSQIAQLSIDQASFASAATSVPVQAFLRNEGPVADSFTANFYVKSSSLNLQVGPAITVSCSTCSGAGTSYTIPAGFKLTASGSNTVTVAPVTAITCAGSPSALTVSVFGQTATNIETCSAGTGTPVAATFTLGTGIVFSASLTTAAGSPGSQQITSSSALIYGVIISAGSITIPAGSVFQFNLAQQGVQVVATPNPLTSGITYTISITGNDGASTSYSGKSS
jgi:archaeal type IV pilus assembly protein PilA